MVSSHAPFYQELLSSIASEKKVFWSTFTALFNAYGPPFQLGKYNIFSYQKP